MTLSNSQSAALTNVPASAAYATFGDFVSRHIGPSAEDRQKMLATLGVDSLQDLIKEVVPAAHSENRLPKRVVRVVS
jgi:glycine cleavage system pyridoxal-binding protein P